jgi:divergent AAA domain protein
MSAFTNGIDGKLVWGIADDDTSVGLADAKGDTEMISKIIKTHLVVRVVYSPYICAKQM